MSNTSYVHRPHLAVEEGTPSQFLLSEGHCSRRPNFAHSTVPLGVDLPCCWIEMGDGRCRYRKEQHEIRKDTPCSQMCGRGRAETHIAPLPSPALPCLALTKPSTTKAGNRQGTVRSEGKGRHHTTQHSTAQHSTAHFAATKTEQQQLNQQKPVCLKQHQTNRRT